MIFRFMYAMIWLLLGAGTAISYGLEGLSVGLFALGGLILGDAIMLTIKTIKEHAEG